VVVYGAQLIGPGARRSCDAEVQPLGGSSSWPPVGRGRQQTVNAGNLRSIGDRPVIGACLVGAIVHAGGGLAAFRSQPVQRALDLTWHALYGEDRAPARWCPAPPVRSAHVRELTRWNDRPERTSDDVMALLHAVERAASAELERARA
jgi:hypothetical protein